MKIGTPDCRRPGVDLAVGEEPVDTGGELFRQPVQAAGLCGVTNIGGKDFIVDMEQCPELASRRLAGDVGAVGPEDSHGGRSIGIGGRRDLRYGEIGGDLILLVFEQQRGLPVQRDTDGSIGFEAGAEIDQFGELIERCVHARAEAGIVFVALKRNVIVVLDFRDFCIDRVHCLTDLLLGVLRL